MGYELVLHDLAHATVKKSAKKLVSKITFQMLKVTQKLLMWDTGHPIKDKYSMIG